MKYEVNLQNQTEQIADKVQPLFTYICDFLSSLPDKKPGALGKLKSYVYTVAGGDSLLADVYVFRAFAKSVCSMTYPSLHLKYVPKAEDVEGFRKEMDPEKSTQYACNYEDEAEAAFSIIDFMLSKQIHIALCCNCGKLFTPKRRDIRYCSRPLSSDTTKTCIDKGAKIQYYSRTISDPASKLSKNIGARLCNRARRHPDNREADAIYRDFIDKRRQWKLKLRRSEATQEEFAHWLNEINEQI